MFQLTAEAEVREADYEKLFLESYTKATGQEYIVRRNQWGLFRKKLNEIREAVKIDEFRKMLAVCASCWTRGRVRGERLFGNEKYISENWTPQMMVKMLQYLREEAGKKTARTLDFRRQG